LAGFISLKCVQLNTKPSMSKDVRPILVATGAFVLVLGGAMIAFASFYVSTGIFRAEFSSVQSLSSSSNASALLTSYSNYADTGELISLVGAIFAPVGAAILAYGLATSKSGEEQRRAVTSTEPMQA
jgi:hypothetical protein